MKMIRAGVYAATTALTISADTGAGYNVGTAFIAAGGSYAVPSAITLTINSGIYVYQSGGTNPIVIPAASFAAGTTLTIINNGYIIGFCGQAGDGGSASGGDGGNGGVGGPAIVFSSSSTNLTVYIDNTNGYIFGGGGGGGGGGGSATSDHGGGGGGGGRGKGFESVSGGAGGTPGGNPGTDGSQTAAGAGGALIDEMARGASTGAGGAGGDFGIDGAAGTRDYYYLAGDGGVGGTAGKAISLIGNAVPTWQGGNNSSQVKGLVS